MKFNLGEVRGAVPTPGQSKVNTIEQMFPQNSTNRPNNINGVDIGNGLGSFPKTINQGLTQQQANLIYLSETFEKEIATRGFEGYRQFFSKETIPLHRNSLTKTFIKSTGIDENPETAALKGLTGWTQTWNEVGIEGSSIEVSTNAYGRFYKKHKFADDISYLDWFGELATKFAYNAARTLDNLAGIRMWEGANKMYVASVDAFDESNPYAARITLANNPSTITANLCWDILLEAKHQFQNYNEPYTVANSTNGDLETRYRKAVILPYQGDSYMLVVSKNGYDQLLADPYFRATYVVNGGYYAEQSGSETLGISTAFRGIKVHLVYNPLTISKESSPKVSTNGDKELEVCWLVGGAAGAKIAVELALEGYTRMITVGYNEDPKVDPFSVLAFQGWMAVVDFAVIRNECFIAIPYVKANYVKTGNIQKVDNWKK